MNNNFINLIRNVIELTEIDHDLNEEDEVLNPSSYAIIRIIEYLIALYSELGINFPCGFPCQETRGGVHIFWDDLEFKKKVWVQIPHISTGETDVYYRIGDDYEFIKNPSIKFLARLLTWFSTGEPLIKGESQSFNLYKMEEGIKGDFIITFIRLLELTEIDLDLNEDEEGEVLNPSMYAVLRSINYLINLYELLGDLFPRGFSSLESRGGINLIWNNQRTSKDIDIRINVKFSPNFEDSVYYSTGNGKDFSSELIINPSIESLHKLLLWINNSDELILA